MKPSLVLQIFHPVKERERERVGEASRDAGGLLFSWHRIRKIKKTKVVVANCLPICCIPATPRDKGFLVATRLTLLVRPML
jgi:hypothetical protein